MASTTPLPGALFDTGLDYPAAVFGASGTIIGRTYRLRTERLDEALAVLDEEEDTVLGLYRRVDDHDRTRACGPGRTSTATASTLTPIESGDWFALADARPDAELRCAPELSTRTRAAIVQTAATWASISLSTRVGPSSTVMPTPLVGRSTVRDHCDAVPVYVPPVIVDDRQAGDLGVPGADLAAATGRRG